MVIKIHDKTKRKILSAIIKTSDCNVYDNDKKMVY